MNLALAAWEIPPAAGSVERKRREIPLFFLGTHTHETHPSPYTLSFPFCLSPHRPRNIDLATEIATHIHKSGIGWRVLVCAVQWMHSGTVDGEKKGTFDVEEGPSFDLRGISNFFMGCQLFPPPFKPAPVLAGGVIQVLLYHLFLANGWSHSGTNAAATERMR